MQFMHYAFLQFCIVWYDHPKLTIGVLFAPKPLFEAEIALQRGEWVEC
jgi:hypothetical protein